MLMMKVKYLKARDHRYLYLKCLFQAFATFKFGIYLLTVSKRIPQILILTLSISSFNTPITAYDNMLGFLFGATFLAWTLVDGAVHVITLYNDWKSQKGEDTFFYTNSDNWHLLSITFGISVLWPHFCQDNFVQRSTEENGDERDKHEEARVRH